MKKFSKKYILSLIAIGCVFLVVLFLLTSPKASVQPNQLVLEKFDAYINAAMGSYLLCPDVKNVKVQPLLKQAFSYYLRKQDHKSIYLTGMAYVYGMGIQKDFNKGIKLVYKSASEGYMPARTSYASLLVDRKNRGKKLPEVNIDQETLDWLKNAALKQDASANFYLAIYYAITGKVELSAPLLEKAAAQQDAPISAAAQYQLGELYSFGYGVPKNDTKSLYWYKKAVNHKPISIFSDGAMAGLMFAYGKPNSPLYDFIESGYWSRQLEKMEQWIKRCQEVDPEKLSSSDLNYPTEPIE